MYVYTLRTIVEEMVQLQNNGNSIHFNIIKFWEYQTVTFVFY